MIVQNLVWLFDHDIAPAEDRRELRMRYRVLFPRRSE